MSAPLDVRPFPIRDAFNSIPNALRFAASLVTLLVGYGVFTVAEGNAVSGLLGLIPGLLVAGTEVYREFKVRAAVAAAEDLVTPVESPAVVVDGELYPAELVPVTA